MARTVLLAAEKPTPWPLGQGACGYCDTPTRAGVRHDLCPGTILDAGGSKGSTWTCACHAAGHDVNGA